MANIPKGPDGKPLKEFDRRELEKCFFCNRGMAADGHIAFYEVRIGQVLLDPRAIQEQAGMEMMMGGNAALAAVFAPTTRVGYRMPETRRLVCDKCMFDGDHLLLPEMWDRSDE